MIEIKNVNYKYPSGGDRNSLIDFNLQINTGEVVVLCGKSGCGKTTVTRLINGLIPHFYEGTLAGEVLVDEIDVSTAELTQIAKKVGSVFQNPKSQFFNVDTDGELAFGCENMALSREEILTKVKEAVREFSLEDLLGRYIFHLSGGEKQQIACGSVYATNPKIYVLDEPSSNMDAKAIKRLQKIIKTLKNNGNTIVISEHRLYYLTELADRFVYMQDGKVFQSFSSKEIINMDEDCRMNLALRTPTQESVLHTGNNSCTRSENNENIAIKISNINCFRGKKKVLDITELEIPINSVTAVIGDNGAGKSTLVEMLSGFLKFKGAITIKGEKARRAECTNISYMVMQDVNRQLFCSSVQEEILLGLPVGNEHESMKLLENMGLIGYKDRHPASLSGGQKQRVAICAALAAGKEFLYYDEPTSGLDFEGMNNLCSLIRENAVNTSATLIITHDLELIMGCCTHVLHLDKGKVISFYSLEGNGIYKVKSYFTDSTSYIK